MFTRTHDALFRKLIRFIHCLQLGTVESSFNCSYGCKGNNLCPSVCLSVHIRRRDLLKLISVREFSDEATFRDPCLSFVLPEVSDCMRESGDCQVTVM